MYNIASNCKHTQSLSGTSRLLKHHPRYRTPSTLNRQARNKTLCVVNTLLLAATISYPQGQNPTVELSFDEHKCTRGTQSRIRQTDKESSHCHLSVYSNVLGKTLKQIFYFSGRVSRHNCYIQRVNQYNFIIVSLTLRVMSRGESWPEIFATTLKEVSLRVYLTHHLEVISGILQSIRPTSHQKRISYKRCN